MRAVITAAREDLPPRSRSPSAAPGQAEVPRKEWWFAMDLDKAMKNPGGAFGTPEALYESGALTAEQKRAVLLQWKDQLQQLQAADDEGMLKSGPAAGTTAELLARVTSTLCRIDAQAT
jgi:hypothetical protein